MIGLSHDIELALDIVIEGLDYQMVVDAIEPDKVKAAMESKLTSFKTAKELLSKWVNSPNSPSDKKFTNYVEKLINSGESSLKTLRKALVAKIDYDLLDAHKHKLAAQTKLLVLNSITELDSSLIELRHQFETGKVILKEAEFTRGFAEKFAYGEFFPLDNYYKKWYNEEEDAVVIDPKGSRGEIIELDGLRVQLPIPPRDRKKIRFHDKKKEDQYWRREELPKGLTPDNAEPFTEYILEQFRIRREGLWFYNNGKPTWLSPRHWMQLQWGKMFDDQIYPTYRHAQLLLYYHKEACYVDSRSMGQIFLKSRQTGYTYGMMSDSLELVTRVIGARTGLTSMTDDDARVAFGKMSYTFQEWPFFFQPIYKGKVDSPTNLAFGKPSNSSKDEKKKKDTTTDGYVNSMTDFEATKVKAYDGRHMKLYIGDESAKWDRASYIEHLGTLLPTTFRGGRVVGKVFLGSTMGKLNAGGEDFKILYRNSKVSERQESGFTSTKLYSYFMGAHTNYENCIDKYGKCWEETPPKGTLNVFGEPILKGSIQAIKEMYNDAKNTDDVALNAAYRAFPMTESHAMRDEADECVFNLTKLTDQWDNNEEVSIFKSQYVRGNFKWENDIRFSKVEFIPDDRGRFKIAWMPNKGDNTDHLRNNVKSVRNLYTPMNDYGCIGVDCFGSYVQGKNKASKGAAHGYSKPNAHGVPTNFFFFEYLDRPATQDIFNEDIFMAAWFYGLPILAENNRRDFVRYIYSNRSRPFSMNRVDKKKLDGDDLVLGGQPMQSKDILDTHENCIRTFIQCHVGVSTAPEGIKYRPEGDMGNMVFNDTISDWMIFNPSARTAHDATISSGLAIMGCQRERYNPIEKKNDKEKNVSLIRKYKNTGYTSTLIK
ncbi:hypothetical protein Phi40:1_gp090 [Cellulophaga phage phi40:1]|uniref:Uncharacterized protein n=1 Tax=Cellulophaga phage phi38:1 TaxID=1327977 RepID=S0A023_9CAUD|nr:terminase large subunit [Cellulophaga phage phi38:1]AGO47955.1 hypothetical protein Phi40:1_gp090 [Cellulophaga phage phi40:1]AGO48120.1 hypothetical protein Phi38:1_gp090 [Cellulophaga phage phi38:1]